MPTNNFFVFLEKCMQANLFTPMGVIKATEMAKAMKVNNFPSFGGVEISSVANSIVGRVLTDSSTMLKTAEVKKFEKSLEEIAIYVKEAAKEFRSVNQNKELDATPLKFVKEEVLKHYLENTIREENSMYYAIVESLMDTPIELSLLDYESPLVVLSHRGRPPYTRGVTDSVIVYVSVIPPLSTNHYSRDVELLFPYGIVISANSYSAELDWQEMLKFTLLPSYRKKQIIKQIMDYKKGDVKSLIEYYDGLRSHMLDNSLEILANKRARTLKKAISILEEDNADQ